MSISAIHSLKQSIWVDFLSRAYLESGGLEKHIKAGISGLTSNPTILKKAISESKTYDREISKLVAHGKDSLDIYEELIRQDITIAARLLYPTYLESNAWDGYVSIEVDPAFAHRVDATIYQAAHLFNLIDSPNIMIKVPGTDAGIEAFRQIIFDGINVNVTLLFSVDQYEKVARAYVKALQNRVADGCSIDRIASVASFFVSRIDTYVDGSLRYILDEKVDPLVGKAAITNARIAYAKYHEIFHSPEFTALQSQGAQPQRLLWASTSTKDPKYDPLKYVKGLIAQNTVNTLPPATLNTIIECKDLLEPELESYPLHAANEYFEHLKQWVNFNRATEELLKDGLEAFATSFDELMSSLYTRISQLKGKKYASGDSKP